MRPGYTGVVSLPSEITLGRLTLIRPHQGVDSSRSANLSQVEKCPAITFWSKTAEPVDNGPVKVTGAFENPLGLELRTGRDCALLRPCTI